MCALQCCRCHGTHPTVQYAAASDPNASARTASATAPSRAGPAATSRASRRRQKHDKHVSHVRPCHTTHPPALPHPNRRRARTAHTTFTPVGTSPLPSLAAARPKGRGWPREGMGGACASQAPSQSPPHTTCSHITAPTDARATAHTPTHNFTLCTMCLCMCCRARVVVTDCRRAPHCLAQAHTASASLTANSAQPRSTVPQQHIHNCTFVCNTGMRPGRASTASQPRRRTVPQLCRVCVMQPATAPGLLHTRHACS